MHALVLEAPGRVVHRTGLPDPVLRDDHDAIIRVSLAGLCGSDLHPYLGREPVRAGTIPGHELVGTVIAAGDGVLGIAVGDRVLAPFTTSCGRCAPCHRGLSARCREGALLGWHPPDGVAGRGLDGAQASLVRIPLAGSTLVAVPEVVDDATALLLGDNFTTGWYGAERAGAGPGRSVAVVGCGAVGLAAISAALTLGATGVVAIDPVEERRDVARKLGAIAAHPDDALEALPDREGVDGVIEAVGSVDAQRLAISLVRPGGTISAIGVHTAGFAFTPADAYDQNLTYQAGRCPVRSLLDRLLPEVAAGRIEIPVEAMISDGAVPLTEGPDAYRRFAARAGGVRKIVFVP